MINCSDEELNRVFHTLRPDITESLNSIQLEVIHSILSGRDTLTVMPTGSGKSVCFQVPAMIFPGLTLVVTPLVSLLQDQVSNLLKNNIPAACISGTVYADKDGLYFPRGKNNEHAGKRERDIFKEIIRAQDRNDPDAYKLLYITPERLRTGAFIRFAQRADISMIAVDEAHCISLWGYEFRKRYLEIPRFMRRIDRHPVVAAFTATATSMIREDILTFLQMDRPAIYPAQREPGMTIRKELSFRVLGSHKRSKEKRQQDRTGMIVGYAREHRDQQGLIYCQTVRQVEQLYQRLSEEEDLKVYRYYASLDRSLSLKDSENKQTNWEAFREADSGIMVTTNALGMGIDLDHISWIIHAGMPLSLENYTQEAGRAGRRGQPAECILFWLPEDRETCETLIKRSLKDSGLQEPALSLRRQIAMDRLQQMEDYCRYHFKKPLKNPQEYIAEYFRNYEPDADTKSGADVQNMFLKEVREIDVLYINNTYIANDIRKGNTEATLTVSKKAGLHASYTLNEQLNYFDMMVADAVYTLMIHRVPRIYPKSIAELLSGNHETALRPERKAVIENSLRRMMRTRIHIDTENSYAMLFFYRDRKRCFDGHFLPLTETNNGFLYDFACLPPLYEYAEAMNNQLFSVPLSALCCTKQPESYVSAPVLVNALKRGALEIHDLHINPRRNDLLASCCVSQPLTETDLLVFDGAMSMMRKGQTALHPELLLKELLEDFRVIGKQMTPDDVRNSLRKLSETTISITLQTAGAPGEQFEGILLPVSETLPVLSIDPSCRSPLYCFTEHINSMKYRYERRSPSRSEQSGHASFLQMAMMHYIIRMVRSAQASPYIRSTRQASLIEFSHMLAMLRSVPGCEQEGTSAKQLSALRNMENRLLKHLKNEGYMHTFSLMENGTVRFLRFDVFSGADRVSFGTDEV